MTWGQVGRAVWNGPFYVGSLTQPISLGSVAMKILETLWRGLVIIVAIVLTTVAAIAGSIYFGPTLFPPLKSRIKTVVSYVPKICSPEYPVLVSIENQTKKAIGQIDMRLEARTWGRSTDLNSAALSLTMDTVLQPGYSVQRCYRATDLPAGTDPATLRYDASVVYVEEYTGPDVTTPTATAPAIRAPAPPAPPPIRLQAPAIGG